MLEQHLLNLTFSQCQEHQSIPLTALWGSVDRSKAFWKLQGKPVLEAELVPPAYKLLQALLVMLCIFVITDILYNRVPLCFALCC